MDINFNCYQCGQNLDVDPGAAGTEVSCPNCGATVVVPHQTRRKEKPAPDYIPTLRDRPTPPPGPLPVVVKNIEMEFGSMVAFQLKWLLAALLALVFIACIIGLLAGLVAGVSEWIR